MKKKLTAKEVSVIKDHMKKAVRMSASDRDCFIARTIGDVYDVELPIPEVIESIFRTERAEPGEHVYYLAPESITKKVLTLTSDCNVTQVKVSPSTRTEVTWTDLISEEYYVCIHDWLKGDHDVLKFYSDQIMEAMNRQEIYSVLQLVDAGAVSESNVFTLDSGKTKFDYPKLIEMRKSVKRYGKKLVLITGADVTEDIDLMDYDSDKQREHGIMSVVDEHIEIEELSVTINASATTVMATNLAYLVAVSDAKNNEPGVFVRRKLEPIGDVSDTEIVAKERAVIDTGNMMNVGANRTFSRGKAGFEEFSGTLINSKCVAKFTRV